MSDIEIIETTDGSEFEVEVFEAVPIIPDEVPHLDHNKLNNREISDQHPMSAITGLEKEIEDIKALKTVESNKIGVANYYEWDGGAAYDTFGYFVSLVTHNSTIKICDGGDIFGVTVGDAAFVGGQNQDVPRDNKYALVVTSGPVDVRCESDVEEGDYVICNGRGEAKKTTTDCGYKVIAINLEKTNQYGTTYATIALGVQACTTDALGKDLRALAGRVGVNEQNIVSAINVANQAYSQSTQSTSVSDEALKKAVEAVLKADAATDIVNSANNTAASANTVAAQSKAIAESAALSATAIKDEAMARANNAWARADEVATETHSLCAKIDKYSVGEYSQAYGLTFEQAQGILEPGMIYVPTKHKTVEYHKEEYSYTEGEETKAYTRWFTPGYLYEWGRLSSGEYGWLTVGNNATVTNAEDYSDSENLIGLNIGPWVYFSIVEPTIHESWEYGYWYTDGETITAKDGSTDRYESYTLYKWETDHWVAVATLVGNASNRMISEVYQTTNEITMGVVNPRGCIAALDARVTDTESAVQQLSEWQTGEEAKMASVKTVANDNGASVVISALAKNGDAVEEMASLVLNVVEDSEGNPTSALSIDADNINFEAENYSIDASKILLGGETTFTTTEKDKDNNDVTKIHGSHIATGTISADKIATDAIRSKNYKSVDGSDNPTAPTGTPPYSTDGTFLDLTNGALYSKNFAIDSDGNAHYNGSLDASQITTGQITAEQLDVHAITSRNYYTKDENGDDTEAKSGDGMKLNLSDGTWDSEHFKIDSEGKINATGGNIGDWNINNYQLESINGNHKIQLGTKQFYFGNNDKYFTIDNEANLSLVGGNIQALNGCIACNNLETNTITISNGRISKIGDAGDTEAFIDLNYNFGPSSTEVTVRASLSVTTTGSSATFTVTTEPALTQSQEFVVTYVWKYGTHTGLSNTLVVPVEAGASVGSKTIGFTATITSYSMTPTTFSQSNNASGHNIAFNSSIVPFSDATRNLGAVGVGGENYRWATIYAATSTINTSDANEKNTILALDNKYSQLFDLLHPVSFKFNNNTSDRTHTGLIAQDVEKSLEQVGLTSKDFAGLCYWDNGNNTKGYGLRYSEFIALCVDQIQKLKKRTSDLEATVATLVEEVNKLKQ